MELFLLLSCNFFLFHSNSSFLFPLFFLYAAKYILNILCLHTLVDFYHFVVGNNVNR
ncbi:hypothetical protein ACRRTK_023820 [Alexandromys fortis]